MMTYKKEKKTDYNNMCGKTFFPFTYKAWFSNLLLVSETSLTNSKLYRKCTVYDTSKSQWSIWIVDM